MSQLSTFSVLESARFDAQLAVKFAADSTLPNISAAGLYTKWAPRLACMTSQLERQGHMMK
jgi:hypothetical protein